MAKEVSNVIVRSNTSVVLYKLNLGKARDRAD